MTRKRRSLLAGAAGLVVLSAGGIWLHATTPGGIFPAVPDPERWLAGFAGADAPDATAPGTPSGASDPVPASPGTAGTPAPAAGALPLPDPVAVPGQRQGAPAQRTLSGLAAAAGEGDRLALLRGNALQNPREPLPWLDLGREWLARGRTDLGRAALRRAWVNSRSDSDRDLVRRHWLEARLPAGELPEIATPARRSKAR